MNLPRHTRAGSRASGLTLLETAFTIALMGLVLIGLAQVIRGAQSAYQSSTSDMALEARGSRALRRIVDQLRTADFASISAVPAPPFSSSQVDFQNALGFKGAAVVWSDPQRIEVDPAGGVLRLAQNPGLADELDSAWGRGVPALLEGETLNGLDDNGNGLIDEAGLCFSRQGRLLTVRLSLQDEGLGGVTRTRTWTTRVACRN